MAEHDVFVECEPTDSQRGNLEYWQRKVQAYKEMLIPPYYPYREALDMVEQLTGGKDE